MKHIIFTLSEPIVGVQRVRNYVYPTDDDVIIVSHADWFTRICGLLKDLHVAFWTYKDQIHLTNDYHIVLDKSCLDEFYITKGKDEMRILDERQYFEEFCI